MADEPLVDRLSRTDLRLALAFFVAGAVVVFLNQMPFLAQVLIGAPLFEEAFKLGLALLPCAALKVRWLTIRLPVALVVGAGFGLLEHALSYSTEDDVILYGRMAFHGLSTGLSMLVLHGLGGGGRRLLLATTLPSTFIHAANNTAAVELALLSIVVPLDADGSLGLSIATGFLGLLAVATVTWPLWNRRYRDAVERHVMPRLGPPAGRALTTPSTSFRS
ncbi:MAG: hypothetical protein WC876_00615 [Candidatus Thermoplasmatota archaeon]